MKSLIRGIHHAGISVPDLDKAVAYYKNATGFEEVTRYRIDNDPVADAVTGESGLSAEVALVRAPNAYLELTQFDGMSETFSEMPVIGPGMTHICFQSPASNPAFPRFEAAGMRLINTTGKPVDLGGYGIVYTYARDPFGNIFELEHFDDPLRSESMWFGHVALVTADIDRLVDFYTSLMGYGPKARGDFSGSPRLDEVVGHDDLVTRAAWFKTGNQLLELWQFVNPETPQPGLARPYQRHGYNKFTFEVSDAQAFAEQLKELGAELISEPTPWRDALVFHARDPEGNRFEVLQWQNADARFSVEPMRWDEDEARAAIAANQG